MNYDQLLYVTELANHHTLQETADFLHISKSGLSQSISQLEKEFGVKLFQRTHQGTELTNKGRELLPYIKQLMVANMNLVHQASRLGTLQEARSIRLAYANTFLKPMLTEFLQHYDEGITLSIRRKSSPQIIEQVRHKEIDAGFIAINKENKEELTGLDFFPIHHGHISLIVCNDNLLLNKRLITKEDLTQQKFALFNDPYNNQLFQHLQFLCGPLQTIIRLDDSWAMYRVITQLNAVCLGRDWQARHSADEHLANLPKINISHIIDDQFSLGWVTNPQVKLDTFTTDLISNINTQLQ